MAFLSLLQGQSTRVHAPKVKIKELKTAGHPVHVYYFKQSMCHLSRKIGWELAGAGLHHFRRSLGAPPLARAKVSFHLPVGRPVERRSCPTALSRSRVPRKGRPLRQSSACAPRCAPLPPTIRRAPRGSTPARGYPASLTKMVPTRCSWSSPREFPNSKRLRPICIQDGDRCHPRMKNLADRGCPAKAVGCSEAYLGVRCGTNCSCGVPGRSQTFLPGSPQRR